MKRRRRRKRGREEKGEGERKSVVSPGDFPEKDFLFVFISLQALFDNSRGEDDLTEHSSGGRREITWPWKLLRCNKELPALCIHAHTAHT
jgi:hypothetical protein